MLGFAQQLGIPQNAHGHLVGSPAQRDAAGEENGGGAEDDNRNHQPQIEFENHALRHPLFQAPHQQAGEGDGSRGHDQRQQPALPAEHPANLAFGCAQGTENSDLLPALAQNPLHAPGDPHAAAQKQRENQYSRPNANHRGVGIQAQHFCGGIVVHQSSRYGFHLELPIPHGVSRNEVIHCFKQLFGNWHLQGHKPVEHRPSA